MKKFIGVLVMGWMMASVLHAQQEVNPCEAEQTQMNMNLCAAKEYREADDALNAKWKQLMAILSPSDQAKMRAMEKLWIQLRDKHCEFESAVYEGGSMQPLVRFSCLKSFTEDRTKQLENLISTFDH